MKKNIQTILLLVLIAVVHVGCKLSSKGPAIIKTTTTTTVTTTVFTTNGAFLAGSTNTSFHSLSAPVYTIVQQPDTICKEVGTFVAFAVRVTWETNATYQWYLDDRPIQDATNREYFIQQCSVTNVGRYFVDVTWPSVSSTLRSSDAFLSVFSLWGTNSTGGTLTTAISQFTGGTGGTTYSCGGATTCDRYFNPIDDTHTLFYWFYGPGISPTSETGPFINYGRNTHLTINTLINDNTNNVGVIVPSGWKLLDSSGAQLDCQMSDHGAGADHVLSDYSVWRVTIYYQAAKPPASGKVALSWSYHSDSGEF
jgi:hypothetical protein